MANPTSDFLGDYQALARESWDAWLRQLRQTPAGSAHVPGGAPGMAAANDTLERTLDGLRGYLDWMQGAVAGAAAPGADWQQQLRQWFGAANQPFGSAFSGIDSAGAQGFLKEWQEWLAAAQRAGAMPGTTGGPVPAFGLDREQQMRQQALAQALMAAAQATARYQALLQRAAADGMQRLQDKLAQHAEPGRQIDSLKALYDLWVDASEEAYAELALGEEFRKTYGDMVNAQMHVRELQQQYTEALCQELGMPTRSEVSSLGKRLQEVRRELRKAGGRHAAAADADAVADLDKELAALRRRLDRLEAQRAQPARDAAPAATAAPPKAARKAAPARRAASAAKSAPAAKAASAAASRSRGKSAKSVAAGKAAPTRPAARKRK